MSLLSDLREHGVRWHIDRVDVPSTRNPERLIGHLRVSLFEKRDDGSEQAHELLLQGYASGDSLERLLATAMRKHLPKHAAYRNWLDAKGNVPVTITADAIEHIGVPLHTAMRKLADSPESAIQWNAVHHLHPDDWSALLEASRVAVRELLTQRRVLRREVGLALKEVWTETPESLRYPEKPVERTDLQKFALLCLHLACKSTEDDEWVWSWTGYLCEDTTQPQGEQEALAA